MIISHYKCFCADDGAKAEDFYDIGDGICCVNCPSGLNEAGCKLMGKYGKYVYMDKFSKLELKQEFLDDERTED